MTKTMALGLTKKDGDRVKKDTAEAPFSSAQAGLPHEHGSLFYFGPLVLLRPF